MYPHRIRLHGPWECQALDPLERSDPSFSVPCRLRLPCTWAESGFGVFAGPVRLVRRFGYPGRIDPHERVWLTFDDAHGAPEVTLNGQALPRAQGSSFEYPVTDLLRPRNELAVSLPVGAAARPWAEVALEVRATAYLCDVRMERAGDEVVASGVVVGHSEGILDLYLVNDRVPAEHLALGPGSGERPFCLRGKARHEDGTLVRCVKVELVRGAVTWYTLEVELPPMLITESGA